MAKRVRLLVGTKKGAFILESDEARRDWSVRGPLCEGWPVHDIIVEPGSGALLVAAGNAWYGPAVWRSEDDGETWTHSSAGPDLRRRGRADEGHLEPGDDARWRAPCRGRAGRPLPQRRRRIDLAARRGPDQPPDPSDLGTGRRRSDRPHDHPPPDRHRPDLGRDLGGRRLRDARRRRLVGATQRRGPGGVQPGGPLPRDRPVRPQVRDGRGRARHASTSATTAASIAPTTASATWQEITGDLPTDFGFAMVAHPRDADTCWVIPLSTPEEGRFMPDGHTAVWRTHDRGASWICSDAGLPTQDAYMSVLREAMARDTLDPVGITFGTATGQVWHSSDEGVSWRMITDTLPEIWAVEAAVVD